MIETTPHKKDNENMIIKPFSRKANYYETDRMGIIHHSNYIRWFEESRVDFMEQLNYPYQKVNDLGIDFALLDVYCEYKSMVRFGDIVDIYVTLSDLTEMRMTINYKIVNKSNEICTLGHTKHFFYNNSKQRPVSLKREIPELYELFHSVSVPRTVN